MLNQTYQTLKQALLDIEGMRSQPYQTKTGSGPQGGIEEFRLGDHYFAGLRLTEKYVMIYLGPFFAQEDLQARYGQQLEKIKSGKSCLKIAKPEKTDLTPILNLIRDAAAGL